MKKIIYTILFILSISLTVFVFYKHLLLNYNMRFGEQLASLICLILLNFINFINFNLGTYLFQKKYLTNKTFKNTLLFFAIIFAFLTIYLALSFHFLNENNFVGNTIPLEVKTLITASILSVTGLSIVYYCQKKGYLNYKLVDFILLTFSILFLLGTSFLLYGDYNTYLKKIVELETVAMDKNKIIDKIIFRKEEAEIYIDLKENRNTLLGYETFLLETAENYDASEYSYANVLKAEIINQLENKKETQDYWDDILNTIYTYDTLRHYRRGENYKIMYEIPSKFYDYEDLGETTNTSIINRDAIKEYLDREILKTNRSPEYIESFWRKNKPYLYTFFSKSKYDEYCKKVINDLIDIKTEVNKHDYKAFYKTYSIIDDEFLSFPDSTFVKLYEYSWPFSFWDRRHEEGNDDVVFKILKEIQTQYQD